MKRLELLAGFRLSEEEREALKGDLETILACFGELRYLDVDGLPPFGLLPQGVQSWRKDEVVPSLTQERALESASGIREGFFAVPLVRGCDPEENW